jgi:hypothetical protein
MSEEPQWNGNPAVKRISTGNQLRRLSGRRLLISSITGLGVTLFGIALFVKTGIFVAHAIKSSGVVQAIDTSPNSSALHVTLLYSDGAGIVRTEKTSSFLAFDANCPSLSVGDTVPVLCGAAAPRHVEINSFEGLWLEPSLVFGVGAFFLIGGLGLSLFVECVAGKMAEQDLTEIDRTRYRTP